MDIFLLTKNNQTMKQLTKAFSYKTILTFLILTFMQALAFAQDSTGNSSSSSTTATNTTTTTTQEMWYSQPWVWIVGGAVLLLLIVALMRGNNSSTRSDKVTVTKSVRTDTDV